MSKKNCNSPKKDFREKLIYVSLLFITHAMNSMDSVEEIAWEIPSLSELEKRYNEHCITYPEAHKSCAALKIGSSSRPSFDDIITLTLRKNWLGFIVPEAQKQEISGILPKEFEDEHHAFMKENDKNFPTFTKKTKNSWCTIL